MLLYSNWLFVLLDFIFFECFLLFFLENCFSNYSIHSLICYFTPSNPNRVISSWFYFFNNYYCLFCKNSSMFLLFFTTLLITTLFIYLIKLILLFLCVIKSSFFNSKPFDCVFIFEKLYLRVPDLHLCSKRSCFYFSSFLVFSF